MRNEALITFKTILSQINPVEHETELIEMVNRLANSEYSNQKQSAIHLIPAIYKFLNTSNKQILLGYF